MENLPWRKNVPDGIRRNKRARRMYAGYLGLCESLDFEVGRLMGGLEKMGLRNKTIVVFTADHGDMLGSHRLYFKNHPFDESARIPLIVSLPGKIKQGKRSTTLASSIDIAPTLLSICGLQPLKRAQGRDLSRCLEGDGELEVESVYCEGRMGPWRNRERNKEWRAVITRDFKLVLGKGGKPSMLFDLENDPLETKNLVADPKYKEKVKDLVSKAREWRERTGDPFPGPSKKAKPFYDLEKI